MNPIVAALLRYAAPVVAESLLVLLRSLQERGTEPESALLRAAGIIEAVERDHPDWAVTTRRACALERIRASLRRSSGVEPQSADVHGLYGLALQRLRSPAGQAPAAPRR